MKQAEIELGYTTIKSPSKGIVIDRGVNMGQIVAPTVNGSVFLIGKIDKLDVWASVNEVDISQIREQQPVRFTVDAFPGKVFEGKVRQNRLNATMTQNVVTYTVVVAISSPTEKLLPYMDGEPPVRLAARRRGGANARRHDAACHRVLVWR